MDRFANAWERTKGTEVGLSPAKSQVRPIPRGILLLFSSGLKVFSSRTSSGAPKPSCIEVPLDLEPAHLSGIEMRLLESSDPAMVGTNLPRS